MINANGAQIQFLLWAVNFLLGLVVAMFGVMLKMHRDSDLEARAKQDEEITLLRSRAHDLSNRVSELLARARWQDEDKKS